MLVDFITLSGSSAVRRTFRDDKREAFVIAGENAHYSRIAFGGRTKRGRSGVALDLSEGKVSGHKMQNFTQEMTDHVRHLPIHKTREGVSVFLSGEDVLIGDEKEGVLLRWLGNELEVFGNGTDSE